MTTKQVKRYAGRFAHVRHARTIGNVDILELSVDHERGVVLGASSPFQGANYSIVEITDVVFDPNLELDILTIEPEFATAWVSKN